MNLLLAVAGAFLLAAIGEPAEGQSFAAAFLRLNLLNFVAINIFLAVFNMLPLPPFDGGHVVEGLLPRRLAVHYAKLHRFALPLFILLLLVLPALSPNFDVVGRLVRPPVDWLTGALLGGVTPGR
jgi:Zn-dependent protease